VHQLLGEGDLALDGGQVAVDINAPPLRVLIHLLHRPHRDRDALRASSSALTTSDRRRAVGRILALELLGDCLRLDVGAPGPPRSARPGKSV
jgi:hypothetical protein